MWNFALTEQEKLRIVTSGALHENRLRILEATIRWAVAIERAYNAGAELRFNTGDENHSETDDQTKLRIAEEEAWTNLCDMGVVG